MKSINPLTLPAGPGATRIEDAPKRNPYDISTWGPGCGRGIPHADRGTVTDGQPGAIRKIGNGRRKAKR